MRPTWVTLPSSSLSETCTAHSPTSKSAGLRMATRPGHWQVPLFLKASEMQSLLCRNAINTCIWIKSQKQVNKSLKARFPENSFRERFSILEQTTGRICMNTFLAPCFLKGPSVFQEREGSGAEPGGRDGGREGGRGERLDGKLRHRASTQHHHAEQSEQPTLALSADREQTPEPSPERAPHQ